MTNYELYELSVDFVLSMIRKVVKKAHCLPKVTNYPACTNYPVTNYTAFTVLPLSSKLLIQRAHPTGLRPGVYCSFQ